MLIDVRRRLLKTLPLNQVLETQSWYLNTESFLCRVTTAWQCPCFSWQACSLCCTLLNGWDTHCNTVQRVKFSVTIEIAIPLTECPASGPALLMYFKCALTSLSFLLWFTKVLNASCSSVNWFNFSGMFLILGIGLSAPKFTVAQHSPNFSRNHSFIKVLKWQCGQIFYFISRLETRVILFKLPEGEIKVYQ